LERGKCELCQTIRNVIALGSEGPRDDGKVLLESVRRGMGPPKPAPVEMRNNRWETTTLKDISRP
jgi:hypothetical protein